MEKCPFIYVFFLLSLFHYFNSFCVHLYLQDTCLFVLQGAGNEKASCRRKGKVSWRKGKVSFLSFILSLFPFFISFCVALISSGHLSFRLSGRGKWKSVLEEEGKSVLEERKSVLLFSFFYFSFILSFFQFNIQSNRLLIATQ